MSNEHNPPKRPSGDLQIALSTNHSKPYMVASLGVGAAYGLISVLCGHDMMETAKGAALVSGANFAISYAEAQVSDYHYMYGSYFLKDAYSNEDGSFSLSLGLAALRAVGVSAAYYFVLGKNSSMPLYLNRSVTIPLASVVAATVATEAIIFSGMDMFQCLIPNDLCQE